MEVLAIIPARSGSKSVTDKNIRFTGGKPMLAHSICHARESEFINRIVVSTDSEKYAEIARNYGAETPFLRPAEYATDTALDIDVFRHALEYLWDTEHYLPDIIVQLRPTYPVRDPKDIDRMVELLIQNPEADSVRCIAPAKELAYKMWRMDQRGRITPILKDIEEAYNMPRQQLPPIYYQNACIDVIRTKTILESHSMSGSYILGYKMEHNYDIDTEEELNRADRYLKLISGNKKFVFDIDGVIAEYQKNLDYVSAKPNQEMISAINQLYDSGNYIVLFTARGTKTGIDWEDVTQKQMRDWGVKYHELKFGKPDADFYIDDKMADLEEIMELFHKSCVDGSKRENAQNGGNYEHF